MVNNLFDTALNPNGRLARPAKTALKHYLRHKENCKNYYKTRYNNDEEFREKHKKASRDHYHNNKEKYAERYQQQKLG